MFSLAQHLLMSLWYLFNRLIRRGYDLDLKIKCTRGWGDGLVGKALVEQEQRPEFSPQLSDFKKLNGWHWVIRVPRKCGERQNSRAQNTRRTTPGGQP